MQTSHNIEIKPNNKQRTYFAKACGVSRLAYNWALAEWNKQYEASLGLPKELRPRISGMSLKKEFNAIKREKFPFVMEVTKYACQQPFLDLDKAFKRFFLKKSQRPRFHKKGVTIDSFYIGGDQFSVKDRKMWVPNLGWVKLKEGLRFKGRINSATVSRTADKWFVSIQIEIPDEHKAHGSSKSVGVDIGVKSMIVTSDGYSLSALKPLRDAERRLAREQRRLAKKAIQAKKGGRKLSDSKNYQKQKLRVAKIHLRVSNIRKDSQHKVSNFLTKNYSSIAIEDLNVSGMLKNHKLARSIADVGFGELRRQIEYKAKREGSKVFYASTFFPSSKACNSCGCIKEDLKMSDRVFSCECGHSIDRDLNAALNIRGLIGGVTAEFTPVEMTAMQRSVYPITVTSIEESGIKHQTHLRRFG